MLITKNQWKWGKYIIMYKHNRDEYLEATQEALINQSAQEGGVVKGKSKIFLPILLASIVGVGYFAYNGISQNSTNEELLVTMEAEVENDAPSKPEVNLSVTQQAQKSEQPLVASTQEKPKEYFVISVKKGDTLASLSKKYFGNEMSFD